jgi:aminoglycoside/choline kinase family phosphotransferase
VSEAQFLRWFDRMGVQRHLKAAGIFARLNHRDGKPGYLADIPRTLGYIVEVGEHDAELAFLGELVRERVLPRLAPRR